jgi:flagellar basal-body rod modification protein FlgD
MDIPPTALPGGAERGGPTGPAGAPNAAGPATGINADFQTFLDMLTTQMQNQDPLNPADPTEFATQLATFSSVEQQVRTNELLVALGQQMGSTGAAQLSQWLGMTARAEMPVRFEGAPVTVETPGHPQAETAELVVTDMQGQEVQRLPVDTAGEDIEWAGTTQAGDPLADGDYSLSVTYSADGETLATAPVRVEARIVEARNADGAPVLIMDTGQRVSASDILGLRAPDD